MITSMLNSCDGIQPASFLQWPSPGIPTSKVQAISMLYFRSSHIVCACTPKSCKVRIFQYATWRSFFLRSIGPACWLDTCPTEPEGAIASLRGDAVAWCGRFSVVTFIGDASWVGRTRRSPVPVSLHLLALQPKPSLPSLRALERPLFTSSHSVLIPVTRRGRKG